jgi:hypothetical protein
MTARVDIRRLHGYGYSRNPEGKQGLAGMNCRAAAKSVSSAPVKASAADARPGKFGSGVPGQERTATGWLPESGATAGRHAVGNE